MKNTRNILLVVIAIISLNACVEPFDFETELFESVLVVEGTITNELMQHEIILSRSFRFEEDGPMAENDASVSVVDATGSIFAFSEIDTLGRYISDVPFQATQGNTYQLTITLADGSAYQSSMEVTPEAVPIEDLYGGLATNNSGESGIAIYVDTFDPTGNAQYFRFQYEETYKVVAPFWRPIDLVVTGDVPPSCFAHEIARSPDKQVCYATAVSNSINQVSINNLVSERLTQHQVRFLQEDDFIISYRYSILVKQFVQNRDAFTYFQTLNDFSGTGSLFSQAQAGFIIGNIFSEGNSEEKVIGFFEVSTVSTKRLFFSYENIYPGKPRPEFVVNCIPFAPSLFAMGPSCGELIKQLELNEIVYFSENEEPTEEFPGPYFVVKRPCGDCTALGESEPPDFWVEE